MITGVVNANHEATVPLVVHDAHGQQQTIEAVIDTGFTGSLTLPSTLIAVLGVHGEATRDPAIFRRVAHCGLIRSKC